MASASSNLTGSSVYETWVMTLRAWKKDPTIPLLHLPQLSDDQFTPDTYARLGAHIGDALKEVTDRWYQELLRAVRTCDTPSALGRELIAQRTLLGRRLQLARHPSLPAALRAIYEASALRDLRGYQQELEDAYSPKSGLPRAYAEQMTAAVRDNPLTGVLRYDVAQDGSRIRARAAPVPMDAKGSVAVPGRTLRRITPTL